MADYSMRVADCTEYDILYTLSSGARCRFPGPRASKGPSRDPLILSLDETTGSVPHAARRDAWGEVRRLNQQLGMNIFLTTQQRQEAGSESLSLAFEDRHIARQAYDALQGMDARLQADRDVVRLYMPNAALAIPAAVNRLQEENINPVSLTLTQPSLDDVFLQVTGERLQPQTADLQPAV